MFLLCITRASYVLGRHQTSGIFILRDGYTIFPSEFNNTINNYLRTELRCSELAWQKKWDDPL